ncbi:MAG: transglutaminase-like domain-containing protein, partial [Myxococcota bacterium]
FVFVRDEISQSLDVETEALPCSASQVLKAKTGLSYAKSHLLAALLRSRGVPAGFAYQRIFDPGTTTGLALHGIVVAWFSSLQSWVPLDPRGNSGRLRSEFRTHPPPSLAHEPDPDSGAVLYPVIYARPLRRVVDLLDRADALSRIRRHLPADMGP